jgi:arsenate reductase
MKGMIFLYKLYYYPKCSTCKKAVKWIEENEVDVEKIHIVENPPSKEELMDLYKKSELTLKKFFNTSGMKYRELGLKDKLAEMTDEKAIELLASDGMLIKRPLITDGKMVLLGFKEAVWEENLK